MIQDPNIIQDPNTKQWAMFIHFSQFAGLVIPFAGLVLPLVLWQIKRDEMPELDAHGKMVANWIISELIYCAIAFVLTFVVIGIFGFLILGVLAVVFPIVGGIKAGEGKLWNYPLSFKFL